MARPRALGLAVALVAAVVACEAAFPLGGYEGPPKEDGGAEASSEASSDDASDDAADVLAPVADAPAKSAFDASDAGPDVADPCARFSRGPRMVRAGAICIDATEVTEAQYEAFMADKHDDTSGQVAQCTWNTSWSPVVAMCGFDPIGQATFPVNGIDWCDAWGFCAWAGKRLCGRVGGGVVPSTDGGVIDDPKQSERTAVCTKGGLHKFPYGDTFDKNACNGGEHDGTRVTVPVGTTPGCEGGYPGVFDMAGNVHEWENACDTTTAGAAGANDICAFRGGSYHDTPEDSCFTDYAWKRGEIDCDIGFRCCADP